MSLAQCEKWPAASWNSLFGRHSDGTGWFFCLCEGNAAIWVASPRAKVKHARHAFKASFTCDSEQRSPALSGKVEGWCHFTSNWELSFLSLRASIPRGWSWMKGLHVFYCLGLFDYYNRGLLCFKWETLLSILWWMLLEHFHDVRGASFVILQKKRNWLYFKSQTSRWFSYLYDYQLKP